MQNEYSSQEVMDILNITYRTLAKLTQNNVVKLLRTEGMLRFYDRSEVDSLVDMLHSTYGLEYIHNKIKDQLKLGMDRQEVRRQIKKYNPIKNPLDAFDLRIKKEELGTVLDEINKGYKPKKKTAKANILGILLQYHEEKDFKFITNEKDDSDYVGYFELRKYQLEYHNIHHKKMSIGKSHVIPHILRLCKRQSVTWYTDKNFKGIYILRIDLEKYSVL